MCFWNYLFIIGINLILILKLLTDQVHKLINLILILKLLTDQVHKLDNNLYEVWLLESYVHSKKYFQVSV